MADPESTSPSLSQLMEMEAQHIEALGLCSQGSEREHPGTLTVKDSVACIYTEQGRFDEAEKLHMEVMNARQRVVGQEHPDTLTVISQLAVMYSAQGLWKETEALEVQVVETSKRVLGEDHPNSFTAMVEAGVHLLKSATVGGGGEVADTSYGDMRGLAWSRRSKHAYYHG